MDANTINKYKKMTLPKLKERAIYFFNKFIRLRDCDENGYATCISSGQRLRYGSPNYHAGHFYSAGKYEQLRFNEDNVHSQGKSDNYFAGANILEYRKTLIKKIGAERVEQLDFISDIKTPVKRTRFDYIEIIETYKAKCKAFQGEKNFRIK